MIESYKIEINNNNKYFNLEVDFTQIVKENNKGFYININNIFNFWVNKEFTRIIFKDHQFKLQLTIGREWTYQILQLSDNKTLAKIGAELEYLLEKK